MEMSSIDLISISQEELERENTALRTKLAHAERKLAESQELLQAMQHGSMDAVIFSGPDGDRVFSLKDSECAYRALVEAMSEGAATIAADGTVLYCNGRLSDFLESPLERIIGSPVTRHLSQQTASAVETLLNRVRLGDSITVGINLRNAKGRCVPVLLSLRRMNPADNGNFCMVLTDLTERKAQDELIAAGKLSRLILESVGDAIAVCDQKGNIISANKALESLCGCNPLFQPFDVVLPLETTEESDSRARRFQLSAPLNGATFRGRRMLFHRRDGQTVPLLTSAVPLRSPHYFIAGCVLSMTDITERERDLQALRLVKERFEIALRNSPMAVFNQDLDLRYTWIYNPALGYHSDEAIGKLDSDIFERAEDAAVTQAMKQEVITTGVMRRKEVTIHSKGVDRCFDLVVEPLRDGDGRIAGVTCAALDITERKQADEDLRHSEKVEMQRKQLQALAARLQRAREEERKKVARDLHDQIGQILTAIKMDITWVLRHLPDAQGTVRERIASSVKLINEGVLSVRSICSGLRPGILDDLGLEAAIEWQGNEFASRTGISFNANVPASELRLDSERATAIFRIFQESLTNVARHAEATSICTTLFEDNDELVLTVKDDGKGFCEPEAGTSLGLLGMKERAQACGGDVQVSSSPGQGTAVSVRIPLRAADADPEDHADTDSR
jgi:PAS domain S-box-containing protein